MAPVANIGGEGGWGRWTGNDMPGIATHPFGGGQCGVSISKKFAQLVAAPITNGSDVAEVGNLTAGLR